MWNSKNIIPTIFTRTVQLLINNLLLSLDVNLSVLKLEYSR